MPQSGDVLQRFLEVLIRQITDTRPEYLTGPFTVAEIYQDLVPYRSHRDLIGVEMNGDYEDALARMLAGEGEYLLLDSEVGLRELQQELASPNPNTSLFREFAAVDVRLHPSRVPSGVGTGPEVRVEASEAETISTEVPGAVPGAEDEDLYAETPKASAEQTPQESSEEPADWPTSENGGSVEDGVVGHIDTVTAPPPVSLSDPAPDGTDSTSDDPGDLVTVCHWCREDLPARDSIRFCPFCGSDLRPSPCRECGEAMEAQWQFCASCGTGVRG